MDITAGPHVLIIGAGITGLLIAQGLKKVWFKVSKLENKD
jgi:2-polyprenyl-6-methoxyphenol hydroxylase-like FAD-dependent oxidoreductase